MHRLFVWCKLNFLITLQHANINKSGMKGYTVYHILYVILNIIYSILKNIIFLVQIDLFAISFKNLNAHGPWVMGRVSTRRKSTFQLSSLLTICDRWLVQNFKENFLKIEKKIFEKFLFGKMAMYALNWRLK